ncbi:MAG: response regulator transcription factor [Nitratireductor sp.]
MDAQDETETEPAAPPGAVRAEGGPDGDAGTLIAAELLGLLSDPLRTLLETLARAPDGLATDRVDAGRLVELCDRFPALVRVDAGRGLLTFRAAEVAAAFRAAVTPVLARQGNDAGASETGGAPRNDGTVAAILAAQKQGDFDEALRLFYAGGREFFMHFHGLDQCLQVLDGFPEDWRARHNVLVFAYTMHALKSGNVSRARHLISRRFGAESLDLNLVLDDRARFPLDFRLFRFLMAMYEDIAITDRSRALVFDALGEVPLDDHLQRGSFYNAMLEVAVRRREYDAADEIARRSRHHYRQAGAHLLGFYVDLYQAILCLLRVALTAADGHARHGEQTLARVSFDTSSDGRLLGLVKAVIRYEQGDVRTLVRFLNDEFDRFAYGEIWPTVAELAINYGGQALSRHVSSAAARVFLDKWRVQEWRSNRFRLVITLREVAILQNGNRWQEAADLLTAVQARANRTWVEGAVENLIRLVDPQEIALVMAWLRHLIWEVPRRPMLRDQIAALLSNDHLTDRQRVTLRLWSAHLARLHRDITAARSDMLKALEACARLGTIMPLAEEPHLVKPLLDDKRIGSFVLVSNDVRQAVRRLKALDMPASDGPRRAGLTRKEMKVLLLVVEGGTNKFVARQLGLSEATVKFHLSNIYRKIGCRRRAEAIATAKALGWVE